MEDIRSFRGEYSFLSNFHLCDLNLWGLKFPSSEHAYVYSKNPKEADKILNEFLDMMPGDAKHFGSKVQTVPRWEQKKTHTMAVIVFVKFAQNMNLQEKLILTGGAQLVEANYWKDQFWGVSSETGIGHNHLGKILMAVRDSLSHPRGSNLISYYTP